MDSTQDSKNQKLGLRLADMLKRLNEGQSLRPKELAEQYQVSIRTMQRDILERFAFLQLEEVSGAYKMADYCLGKLSTRDITRFATLAGVAGLFPSLDREFLRSVLDVTLREAYAVKGTHFEDASAYKREMQELEQAIIQHRKVNFTYKDVARSHIAPYKLVNHKGCWYLAATQEGVLKAFKLSGIQGLIVQKETFVHETNITVQLEQDDSIWYALEKTEVVLSVAHDVAPYFERRKLIPSQEINKKLSDGGLIVTCKVAHDLQILPIVRYWMPHVRIISPASLQKTLNAELHDYLERPETA